LTLVKVPFVDLKAQYESIRPEIDAAIQRVLTHHEFILGVEAKEFEKEFAKHVHAKGAVGVASGTAALHLSLLACGVGAGDEVITTAHTFFATAEAIAQTGAKPVFVDINARTYNIDPERIDAAITPRTKAIVPVHLYGQTAPLDAILEIAQKHGLRVIEDAAQAHGAECGSRRSGAIGDLACFSFYPGKNLGAYGDAGAVTGDDETLLAKVRSLRDHGRTSKYQHDQIGYGERLDGIQAAILRAKLPHLEAWTEARRANARKYNELLQDSQVVTPHEVPGNRHVYHLYVVRVANRDRVMEQLKAAGISSGIHYPIPMHQQPAFCHNGYAGLSLPATEKAASEIISLPMFPELTNEQIAYVADALKEATHHA
jgi:dTDP-4-amino-4,6-dideoxygalactose transaminase